MADVKMSSKNQIVIPREAREHLNIRAGDRLLYRIEDGRLILERRPRSFADALEGILSDAYADAGKYLQDERSSWAA